MKYNNFWFQGATILNKNEMKCVRGGDYRIGTCAFITKSGFVYSGVSKQMALDMVSDGGKWCCDSCDEATWLK